MAVNPNFTAATTRLAASGRVDKSTGEKCRKMQEKLPPRSCIYVKDVMNITGRRERAAWKLLAKIRHHYGKQKGQFITVKEFSLFTGIDEASVRQYLHS
jgi:hypothetical protein